MTKLWSNSIATIPGALVSLLPTATCPACLGAYAGLVSALGVGFLFKKQVLVPLIVVFLLVGLAGAILSYHRHHRLGPLASAIGGSVLVGVGRIFWDAPVLVYAGAFMLAAAAIWSFWLRRMPTGLVQVSTR